MVENIKQLGSIEDRDGCHTSCSSVGYSRVCDMTFKERYDMYMKQEKEKLASMLAERDLADAVILRDMLNITKEK